MFTYNFHQNFPISVPGNPYITNIHYIQAKNELNWSFKMHTHKDSVEISYILSGKCGLYIDGKVYEAKAGDFVIKNQGVPHAEKNNLAYPVEQICINISGLQIEGMPANNLLSSETSPVITSEKHQELLSLLFRKILNEVMGNNGVNEELANVLMCSALQIILYETKDFRIKSINKHENIIKEIKNYIDQHFKENLSLDLLSTAFHISIYHLSRQFKKYIGYTVNNYIVSCRLGEAQKRLLFSSEAIADIAKSCGYSNLSYFYTVFRKKVGYTPSEYRQQYQTH
ncbi:AraC family transcriptional regulator [Streptococcus caviae]|uniref:AraC family transcriptional regulator n=1 Tax=Streptococcus sp. 'caviae' TaxID=1915004 RepID=UPI00094B8944|nr:AraC family transcriptional regulator [Streptococcus sp. 'caviae']OLN82321.1 hypothetical protein BMI76_09505 [Streptococcus sp. 'caviae']